MNTLDLLSCFSADILAIYRDQPDKYNFETDYFSGEINTADQHIEAAAESNAKNTIHVKFGFRTRTDGDLSVAVFTPDLTNCSSDEQAKWSGFALDDTAFSAEPDERFEMWCQRNFEGNWNVNNGVIAQLKDRVREINAITSTTVGKPLFKFELGGLCFPTAQNNHKFHDAHSEAYKLLIDGFDKNTLIALAYKLGIRLKNAGNSKTVATLKELLPESLHDQIFASFEVISRNRRLADHESRPAAVKMKAFEQFNTDMTNVEAALELIKGHFAASLKVTVKSCVERTSAMSTLPAFDPDWQVEKYYSVCGISKVEGKTVERVEFGWRKRYPGVHNSEMIILHFDDKSSIAIRTGTNIWNLSNESNGLRPDDLDVSFLLDYVPPLESNP